MSLDLQIFNLFGQTKYEPHKGKKHSIDFRFDCPYCLENRGDPDTKGHFFINNKTGLYHCYRCGEHGILRPEKPSNNEIKYNEDKMINNSDILEDLLEMFESTTEKFDKIIPLKKAIDDPVAKKYMNSRGFSDDQIVEYDMRVGGLGSPLLGYVVIPNITKQIIKTDMYCARTFLDSEKRYLNPPQSASGKSVFNLHRIPENPDRIIVCEGALNAIASGCNAVALYGKNCSKEKMNKILSKRPKQVVINLDLDAENKAYELADMMYKSNPGLDIRILLIKEQGFKDAADYLKVGKIDHYLNLVDNAPKYDPILSNLLEII